MLDDLSDNYVDDHDNEVDVDQDDYDDVDVDHDDLYIIGAVCLSVTKK